MSKNSTQRFGVLVINKPVGYTSHDVVARVRRTTGIQQVGHTGTLDPFATGVLLVLVGTATRLAEYTHTFEKTYEATLSLGATSDTDDGSGVLTAYANHHVPTKEEVQAVLQKFIGTLQQTPPAYAAIKVAGKKLYQYARAGEPIVVAPRSVKITEITMLKYEYPQLEVRVICSTGTYIRALARDVGAALECGGYASTLCRTAIGKFNLSQAHELAEITVSNWSQLLLPPGVLVEHLPQMLISPDNVAQLEQGRGVSGLPAPTSTGPLALLHDETHELVGIGIYEKNDGELLPKKIFSAPSYS